MKYLIFKEKVYNLPDFEAETKREIDNFLLHNFDIVPSEKELHWCIAEYQRRTCQYINVTEIDKRIVLLRACYMPPKQKRIREKFIVHREPKYNPMYSNCQQIGLLMEDRCRSLFVIVEYVPNIVYTHTKRWPNEEEGEWVYFPSVCDD